MSATAFVFVALAILTGISAVALLRRGHWWLGAGCLVITLLLVAQGFFATETLTGDGDPSSSGPTPTIARTSP